jgi:putative phage-type endonuclease
MQRDEAWFARRRGKLTGSAFGDLMNMLRDGKPGASRRELVTKLALERLTGVTVDGYQNEAMRRGIELEPEARAAYEAHTGELVELVDFIDGPVPYVGVSPDGLIGDDGMVEFKCPASQAKHLEALRRGEHAVEYRWQLQGQLWVAKRAWVAAASYDNRFPEPLRLAIARVYRDETAIEKLAAECERADTEINAIVAELGAMQEAA